PIARSFPLPGALTITLNAPNTTRPKVVHGLTVDGWSRATAANTTTIAVLRRTSRILDLLSGPASLRACSGQQSGVPQNRQHAAPHRTQQPRRRQAPHVDDEVERRVDQPSRAALIGRVVVQKVKEDAHVQRPQQRRRRFAHVVREPLLGERFLEDANAQLALPARGGTEPRQGMIRLAAVAEE